MPKQRTYTEKQVARVCRLLADGWSYRQISIQTGVKRSSVSLIAHEDFPRLQPAAAKGNRCPTCGAKLTVQPCVRCRTLGLA